MLKKIIGGITLVLALPFAASAATVEETVRDYFNDVPVMSEIARCESKFRQFNDSGTVLHGGLGGTMIGIFQISEGVHRDFALEHGMNIDTIDGNMAYARYLYEHEGTQPWISSFPCWGNENIVSDQPTGALTKNLSFGMIDPQVLLLQQTLNQKGYVIATDGPGSPGNETNKFGFLTRDTVRKFQCAVMQICNGDEYTNGYGFVGVRTRAALAAQSASVPAQSVETTHESAPSYSADELKQIADLQAQIAYLQSQLQKLLAGN